MRHETGDAGETRDERQPDLAPRVLRISPSISLKLTLKAWPVITAVTIGLCYLTQQVAKLFGIDLPDQKNIEVVRQIAGFNWRFALVCIQVLLVMPALEELVFRYLLVGLPARKTPFPSDPAVRFLTYATVSSALFSAAHYLAQPWPDAAFVALFFFGFAQCWLYRMTDRLWCAMLNHALFNLTNLVLLFILPEA